MRVPMCVRNTKEYNKTQVSREKNQMMAANLAQLNKMRAEPRVYELRVRFLVSFLAVFGSMSKVEVYSVRKLKSF